MRTFENHHKVYLYIEPLVDGEPDERKRKHISNLLCFLEDYLNITTNQYIRVKENYESLFKPDNTKRELYYKMNIMFGDIHFMLISMEKAYALSIRMFEILGRIDAADTIRKSEDYKIVKFFRNNLEHMNDKLTVEDHKYRESWYSNDYHTHWFARQWGGMRGNTIKLGPYSFNIDESSFAFLWDSYDQIFKIITDEYVIPNKINVDLAFKGHMTPQW